MKKTAFWKADWFLGLVVAVVLLVASGSDFIQSLERQAYDLGVRASSHAPSQRVAVIAIDDQSIANIGRWPWPREIHAQMIGRLEQAEAKVIGYASFFFEPQVDPGLAYIHKLAELYQTLPPAQQQNLAEFASVLNEADDALNSDRKLAAAVAQAGNVALPMLFTIGEPRGNPDHPLADYVLKNQITKVSDRIGAGGNNIFPVPTFQAIAPLEEIAAGAAAMGHLNALPDVDGSTRTEPLVVRYYDQYFPSFSLVLAARSLNLGPADIEMRLGEGVKLGNLTINTDPYLQMYTYFYKDRDGKPAVSAGFLLRRNLGKDPGGEISGQGRVDRRYRCRCRNLPGDADFIRNGAGCDSGALGVQHSRGGFLCRAHLGFLGGKGGVPAGRAVSDSAAAAAQGRHGLHRECGFACGSVRRAFRADGAPADVDPADGLRGVAGDRPRPAYHQALSIYRARQGQVGPRFGGIQPHAGPGFPGTGPARHGLRQVQESAARRSS